MKKIILFSIIISTICSAYGGFAYGSEKNYQQIVKVANEYMASISGGGISYIKPSKIIKIKGGDMGEYGVIYEGIPVEDSIGATGGNYGMDFVDVRDAGLAYYVDLNKSTPKIKFSDWPILKYISQHGNSLTVIVSKYGPKDEGACMSDVYRETLVREISGNWKETNLTLLKDDACKDLE